MFDSLGRFVHKKNLPAVIDCFSSLTIIMFSQFLRQNLTRSSNVVGRRLIHVEAKIESLGLAMPNPAVPKGKFVNFVQIDNMVYLSGHLPQVGYSFIN